jgi:YesN/AraC family two-component response regulator
MDSERSNQERIPNCAPLSFIASRLTEPPGGSSGCDRNLRAQTNQHSLLWIDDEISSDQSSVRVLEVEGFRVHCAVTGSAGLAMARARRYHAILLDLRLPDMPGLAVLEILRSEDPSTPVLILTGFGDFETARAAGRLGVDGFEIKPLFGDDLLVAVLNILPLETTEVTNEPVRPRNVRAGLGSLATLLELLHRVLEKTSSPRSESTAHSVRQEDVSRTLKSALVRALASPDLPMPIFLACALALRRLTADDGSATPADEATGIERMILDALARPESSDRRVRSAIEMIRTAARTHRRPTIEAIAKTLNIDPTHLGRLISTDSGFGFRDWRTAFMLRPSVSRLLETNDAVKEIACGFLDFSHLSQFDREFHRFFGVTPTEFRHSGHEVLTQF